MTWQEWLKLLLPIITPLAVAILAYLNFLRYRRIEAEVRQEQREYEIVRKRYLDEGLDELIANVQTALTTYQYNWSVGMSLLKQVRDFKASMSRPDTTTFRPLPFDEMSVRPVHRARLLIDDDVVWNLVQLLSAFMFCAKFDLEQDLVGGIHMILNEQVQMKIPKEEIIEMYHSKLIQIKDDANFFFIFLSLIHNLSTLFEKNRFTFSTVASFSKHTDVQDLVRKLHHLQSNIETVQKNRKIEQPSEPDK